MNDIEQLKQLDLEDRIKFLEEQNKKLKKEVKRLTMLLNGDDVIQNSLK